MRSREFDKVRQILGYEKTRPLTVEDCDEVLTTLLKEREESVEKVNSYRRRLKNQAEVFHRIEELARTQKLHPDEVRSERS